MSTQLRTTVRWLGNRLGMDVVERTIYSPVPSIPPPDDDLWVRRSSLVGVELSLEWQRGLLEEDLAPHIAEFERRVVDGEAFPLWNGWFQAGDAEALYAILRWSRPQRVLELGSGYSTMVAAAAAVANERDGHPIQLTACDPSPRTPLEPLRGVVRHDPVDVRELPLERFLELRGGDVLFVDTSHSVKLGSEVNRLILEVLPRLADGVIVHFHDVFLPYEYPRYLFELGGFFNEQYALHAFLIGNRDWEVLLGLAALYLDDRDRTTAVIPSLLQDPPGMPGLPYVPASFWIRKHGERSAR